MRPRRIAFDHRVGQPELDGQSDELLLGAVVDVPFDLASLFVLRGDQPLTRRAELLDQANVAQDEARLGREVFHQLVARGSIGSEGGMVTESAPRRSP